MDTRSFGRSRVCEVELRTARGSRRTGQQSSRTEEEALNLPSSPIIQLQPRTLPLSSSPIFLQIQLLLPLPPSPIRTQHPISELLLCSLLNDIHPLFSSVPRRGALSDSCFLLLLRVREGRSSRRSNRDGTRFGSVGFGLGVLLSRRGRGWGVGRESGSEEG